MGKITKSFQYGHHEVTLETGRIAKQADSAVLIRMGDTVLLITVVAQKQPTPGQDFFPLTVHYQEKSYAAGKVPGGYFKREGRPTEKETLVSRLIDRPLRPLFPEGFTNEVQIVVTVLAMDPAVPTDVPAIIGSAAALALSGIPFNGPLAAARVGFIDGHYLLNPSFAEIEKSRLNLVVAGTRKAVLMVESSADQLSEAEMLGAVLFGHEQMQVVINAITEFAGEGGKERWSWQAPEAHAILVEKINEYAKEKLEAAYQIAEKVARQQQLTSIRQDIISQFCQSEGSEGEELHSEAEVNGVIHNLESDIVRQRILSGERRIDGRDTVTIRPITVETNLLPRVHGSALFTRGETQALAVTTLGTSRDAQVIDDLEKGEYHENFILHYNFPPYSVGEIGFMSGPKRREIGHGRLARKAFEAMLPNMSEFPYVIRIVSEITESNGSSSMATICAASLSLMDAGVPIKSPVAGIAMGLIKEEQKYAILSDILGDEDHLGDMDFKVAGTLLGITALQMDIKIDGITREIMERALEQARQGRLHILGIMNEELSIQRAEVSDFAPRIVTIKIDQDKIRDVIGKGGVTIREITETTGATIDIAENGLIKVAAVSQASSDAAIKRIQELTASVDIGGVYEGTVIKLMDFGAIVSFLGARQGLVHISQIADHRVEEIRNYLQEGQSVKVKVLEIDRQGRIRLSMKSVEISSDVQEA